MNTRIHSFKVYLIETRSGNVYWTFHKPIPDFGDKLLMVKKLWDLLYLAREGAKRYKSQKSLVRKTDLEFLLTEIASVGGIESIAKINI